MNFLDFLDFYCNKLKMPASCIHIERMIICDHLNRDARKLVFRISDQVPYKSVCTVTKQKTDRSLKFWIGDDRDINWRPHVQGQSSPVQVKDPYTFSILMHVGSSCKHTGVYNVHLPRIIRN